MSFLKLEDSMLTNVPAIDNQHKELVDRINKLHAAMKEGRGAQIVDETLKFLESYVVKHFSDEEKYMEKYDCPMKDINKKAHKIFIDKLKFFKLKLANGSPVVSLDIYKDLSQWVVHHIITIDQKMAAYIK